MNNFRDQVADAVIKQFSGYGISGGKEDVITAPYNPVTGNYYRGMNSIWLNLQGQFDQRWMTYDQAFHMGMKIHEGAEPTKVEIWKLDGEVPYVSHANVYNGQIAGMSVTARK